MPSQMPDERSIAHTAAQLAAVGETIEVLALTADESLLVTLRQAVGSTQRIWQAVDRDQAVELIMAGRVGVIVVDEPATDGDCGAFCEQLRSQFPDLVLIVAGGVEDQTHLVKQITSGEIYRFLHKPVSTARARQFIEAAMRRHLEGRTFTPEETAPRRSALQPKVLIAAGIGIAVLVAVVAILIFSGGDEEDAVYRQASSEPEGAASPSAQDTPPVASLPPEADEPIPEPASPPSVSAAPPPQSVAPAPVASEQPRASAPAAFQPSPAPPRNDLRSRQPPVPAVSSRAVPQSASPAAGTPANTTATMLARADEALGQDRLVTPRGSNAFELYSAVLQREPANSAAATGLDKVANQLLGNAENALLDGRIDDAARDIEAARGVRPNNVRLAFLSAQLDKERDRRVITQARDAAAKGNHDRARVLIERAVQSRTPPSAVLLEVRKELEQLRRGAGVGNYLRLASERLRQNRLVEPTNDNARHYIEAALAADPANAAALQARRVLADQLLARGRQALAARDPVQAGSWLSQADALGVERAPLRAAQRELQTLRQTTARSDQVSRLVGLINTRLGEDRVSEPAGDSATHYLQELRTLDANNAALQPALQSVGLRLVQQSRQAITAGNLDGAQRTIDDAKRLGFSAPDVLSAERDVAAARERVAFLADVVPANGLARIKQVEPRYPATADRRGIEGWVDLDFTIAADGTVKDMAVRAAQPPGVFEEAATRAISQWVYRPVIRDGRPVEQRARLRLRFDIAD